MSSVCDGLFTNELDPGVTAEYNVGDEVGAFALEDGGTRVIEAGEDELSMWRSFDRSN